MSMDIDDIKRQIKIMRNQLDVILDELEKGYPTSPRKRKSSKKNELFEHFLSELTK